jgi:NFU1 iron-sulfur cluster scaffold homolog, mitochondrial
MDKIKKIIDADVRPFLQRDGGDLKIVSFKDNLLKISYQGACGCCPHAAMGTLSFIEGILKEKYDPKIKVEMV